MLYTLTTATSGTGSGTVYSSPSGINCGNLCTYSTPNAGQSVTLSAVADSGSEFVGWSGACSTSSPTCTVSLSTSRTVTASFSRLPTYTLAVYAGGGGGWVTSNPGSINCGNSCSGTFARSTTVTLTAQANSGYTFSGWSGACSGTATSCTVSMDVPRSVSASFAKIPPPTFIAVSKVGTGAWSSASGWGGSIDCDRYCMSPISYLAPGSTFTISASAPNGWYLAGFTGCSSQSVNALFKSGTCTINTAGRTQVAVTVRFQTRWPI